MSTPATPPHSSEAGCNPSEACPATPSDIVMDVSELSSSNVPQVEPIKLQSEFEEHTETIESIDALNSAIKRILADPDDCALELVRLRSVLDQTGAHVAQATQANSASDTVDITDTLSSAALRHLPMLIRVVAGSLPSSADCPHYGLFFQDCIRILVKCIPLDNIELDESLHTLFGIASQFDEKKDSATPNKYRRDLGFLDRVSRVRTFLSATAEKSELELGFIHEHANEDLAKPTATFVHTISSEPRSFYLLANIHYFGQLGGFEALIERINRSRINYLSLNALAHMLHYVFETRLLLHPSFLQEFAPRLAESVFAHFIESDDERIKPLSRASIGKVITYVERTLNAGLAADQTNQLVETFYLNLSLRFLRFRNVLERKIQGLNDLNSIIEAVLAKEEFLRKQKSSYLASMMSKSAAPPNIYSWATSEFVARLVLSSHILNEEILSERVHIEVLRRAGPMLSILCQHGGLTNDHLVKLCSFVMGSQHESIEHLVYSIISDLCPALALSQLKVICACIEKKDISTFDIQLLKCIFDISNALFRVQTNSIEISQNFGVSLLWRVIQESNVLLAKYVRNEAVNTFVQLLASEHAVMQRNIYLELCISSLQRHENSSQALRLLRSIISIYPQSENGWFSGRVENRNNAIVQLDTKFHLIDLLIQDLVHLKQAVSQDVDSGLMNEDILLRHGVLVFLLSESSLKLNRAQLLSIWQLCVVKAHSAVENEACLQWLYAGCGGSMQLMQHESLLPELDTAGKFKPLSTEDAAYFFDSLVLLQTPDQVSLTGFYVLRQLFLHQNQKSGSLAFELTTSKLSVTVHNLTNIQGINFLWTVAIQSPFELVFNHCIELLLTLYGVLSDQQSAVLNQLQVLFVKSSIHRLSSALEAVSPSRGSDVSNHGLSRCISILKAFSDAQRDSRSNVDTLRHVMIKVQPPISLNLPKVSFQALRSSSVFQLQSMILLELKKVSPPDTDIPALFNLAFVLNGKILDDGSRQMFEFVNESNHSIDVQVFLTPFEIPRSTTVKNDFFTLQPCSYPDPLLDLASPIHSAVDRAAGFTLDSSLFTLDDRSFDRLFSLMSTETKFGSQIWDVLSILPLHPPIIEQFRQMKFKSRDMFSFNSNLFQLCYHLRVVEQLMFTDWCFRFFDSNGLLDLIRMLIDDDHQHFDPSRHGQYGYYAFNQIRLKIVRLVRAALSFDPACGVDMVGSQFSSPSPSIAKGTVFKLFDRDSSSENLLNQLYMVLISRVGDIREGCDSSADFQLDAALNLESQRLIVTCLHSWPALFSVPVSADHIRNWLESSLVQANSRLARLQGARAFSLIFRHHNREFNTSVQVSLQNIIESSPTWLKQRSEPFFLLIASMAEQSSADELYAPLFQTIINRLQSINSIERFDDPAQCDQELLGTLKIMRSLAKRHFHLLCASEDETPEGIIRFVYAKCLFHGLVLAQSVATRDAAFAFLFEASQHRADFVSTIVDQFLHDRIWKTKQSSLQFGYNPASFVKRPIPYVGLKNQGATCYMNSVMQQLFHVAAFRSAVLAANSEKSQNDQPAPSQDSLLYQCQHMFAAMQFSNRKSFDTISFCQSITDFDGQPLRLGEQKDANEFCALLFDKLESELKPTSCPSAVAESFGGVLIDQMVSRECAHIRQRDEPFNMISLDIKNKNTLLQSLDLFVAGDLLDGDNKYMCSTCNAKVSALKRSCFDSTRLPQSLLFHLKRFEFDFDAMRKNKINDSFEFPLEFSIEPYTSEGLRQRDAPNSSNSPMPALSPAVISTFYQYKLVGVVVHTGSADAGHYYSYIQDRNGAGWFQFNDSVVSNWDISELNDSCFGGSQNVEVFDQQSGSKVIRSQPKLHSAYMLVYERCADVDLIRSTVEAMKSTGSTESTSLSQDAVQAACVKQSAALNQMPESIMTLVQQDNAEFQTDTYLYDSSLASFLWNIANLNALGSVESFAAQSSLNAEHAVKLFDQTKAKVCQLMTLFTFRVLSRSRNFSMFCQFMNRLNSMYTRNSDARDWLLGQCTADFEFLKQLLFVGPRSFGGARDAFVDLILTVMNSRRDTEMHSYEDVESIDASAQQEFDVAAGIFDSDSAMSVCDRESELPLESNVALQLGRKLTTTAEMEIEPNQSEKQVSGAVSVKCFRHVSLNSRLMALLLRVLETHWIRTQFRCYDHFFLLLDGIAALGPEERAFLLRNGLVGKLVDFYGDSRPVHGFNLHPLTGNVSESQMRGNRTNPPNSSNMVSLLYNVLRQSSTYVIPNKAISPDQFKGSIIQLPESDQDKLMACIDAQLQARNINNVMVELLKEHTQIAIAIMLRFCWECDRISADTITVACNQIISELGSDIDLVYIRTWFRLLRALLSIQDSLHKARVDFALPKIVEILSKIVSRHARDDERFVMFATRFLLSMAIQRPTVQSWLDANESKWQMFKSRFAPNATTQ